MREILEFSGFLLSTLLKGSLRPLVLSLRFDSVVPVLSAFGASKSGRFFVCNFRSTILNKLLVSLPFAISFRLRVELFGTLRFLLAAFVFIPSVDPVSSPLPPSAGEILFLNLIIILLTFS